MDAGFLFLHPMKFDQIPYTRVDIDSYESTFNGLLEDLRSATTIEKATKNWKRSQILCSPIIHVS